MLRLSNYTIFVDLPNDEVLLVHGYSGAWDVVSKGLVKKILGFRPNITFKPFTGSAVRDMPKGLKTQNPPRLPSGVRNLLVKRGYLTTLTTEQEQQCVSTLATDLHSMASREPLSYVLALTYDCNLSCTYCFQNELRSQLKNRPSLIPMSFDMVDKIFTAMPEIESRYGPNANDKPPKKRRITLFGGEPLLARLHSLVEYVITRARSEGETNIGAVTNGTELHHFADLIGPDKISFLQITLDGAPSLHDRRRIGSNGLPTFDTIARNIGLALKLGAQVKVRVNADTTNIESLPELAQTMSNLGWFNVENFSAYAIAVHESTGSGHQACGFGSWKLNGKLAELAQEYPIIHLIHGPDSPWQRRIREVLRGSRDPLLSLQPSFCGSHAQTWVFDAHGDIYACWERAGYIKDRIGCLSDNAKLIMYTSIEKSWRGRTITSNPVCRRCPYAFYCGGGCALLAELKNGTIHSHYCDDFSRRFKALARKEIQAQRNDTLVRIATATIT